MRILYITHFMEDYLQDQILYGLRQILGNACVDYPKKEIMYSNYSKPKQELYGRGFTLWKLLSDITVDRESIELLIRNGLYNFIIFGSIKRQKELFAYISTISTKEQKFIFLDGEDVTWCYGPALDKGLYFKRERSIDASQDAPPDIPEWKDVIWVNDNRLKTINFSIPSIKIREKTSNKIKLFAKHVQCDEAYKLEEVQENCQRSYAFSNEYEYYEDIANSYFGITLKKAGWDCMRHYEIAANLTIPCFYKLSEKPANCAPHGLVDMKNCISFSSAKELREKIPQALNIYDQLQINTKQWIWDNTCENLASRILDVACKQ